MYGLIPPKDDIRRFSYRKYFGAAFLPPLTDFINKPLSIKDQGNSDMCVAYAVSSSSEKQEGVILEPAYLFAKTKQIMGDWQGWGADPIAAMKASCNYGALESTVSPYSLANGRNFVANWANWDQKWDRLAGLHKKKAYFELDGGNDIFNSIVIGLYDNRAIHTTAVIGVYWQPEWTYAQNGVIKTTGTNTANPHALEIIGQRIIDGTPYLVAQNSWGTGYGNYGIYYFSREVANEFLFALAMIDADPEDVKKVTWGLLEYLKDMLLDLLKALKPQVPVVEQKPEIMNKVSQLVPFAKAIQEHEGWFPGSVSYRNSNPGNLKFTNYTQSLGATGKDLRNFCIFPDEASGFNALCRMVQDAANNQLKAYKNCTIQSFFAVYAPSSDKNNPDQYAKIVASKVGSDVNALLKDII